ncbi:unnamed protein product [Arctogadus glacialis]
MTFVLSLLCGSLLQEVRAVEFFFFVSHPSFRGMLSEKEEEREEGSVRGEERAPPLSRSAGLDSLCAGGSMSHHGYQHSIKSIVSTALDCTSTLQLETSP